MIRIQDTLILALLPMMLLAAGCGRETTIYPDAAVTTQATTPDPSPTVTTDGRTLLPLNLYDQSVNKGLVDLTLDGSTTSALRLQVSPGTNPQGAFNGTGTGNRAILSIGGWSEKTLASLSQITFDVKTFVGSETVSINLLVDLKCDNTDLRVVVADGALLGAGSAQSNGYTRMSATTSDSVWKAEDAAITDPTTSATLVPDTTSPSGVALTDLLTAYPNACLKNAVSAASRLPKGLVMGAVMLILGSDTTVDMNGVYINRVTVGSQVFDKME